MPKKKKTDQAGTSNQKPFNWLEWMDEQALALPPCTDWDNWYGKFFLLARYPELRPAQHPDDPDFGLASTVERLDEDESFFYEALSEYEKQIESHEEANRALEGLSKEQRRQVAALLMDSLASFRVHKLDAGLVKEYKAKGRKAPTRQRKLKRRVDKALNELRKLHDYASQMDPEFRGHIEEMSWTRRDIKWAAERSMKAVEAVRLPIPSSFNERLKFIKYIDNPKALNMVKFYWFFRHGCELSSNESQVRVALIRNAFWEEWAKQVEYLPYYDSVDSQRCTAVRQAVSRFRPVTMYGRDC